MAPKNPKTVTIYGRLSFPQWTGGMAGLRGLLEQLRAFASDTPPAGTTIMSRLVKGYQDADLEALARHFSEISSTPRSVAEGR